MRVRDNCVLQRVLPVHRAPRLRRRNPEELIRGVVKAGQYGFLAIFLDPGPVCVVGLLESATVGNVFALGVDAVEVQTHFGVEEVAVLVHHAIRTLGVGFEGGVVPPVPEVALEVKLISCKMSVGKHAFSVGNLPMSSNP